MTVKEAILTLNANVVFACGRAGFSSATVKMVEDALDTIEDALDAQKPEAMDAPKPDSDIGCWYDITHNYTLEQVVSALKEQEPRLVTEADFENADEYGFIPAWYEGLVNKEGWWNCIPKEALETAKEDGCRYWTSKPSLKQMEETPWQVT